MATALPLAPAVRLAQSLVLLLAPQGGQSHGRRNAWAAMSATSSRGRERRSAQEALHAAEQRASGREALGGGTGG